MQQEKRCDNCIFSTYATGPGRPTLICKQQKGAEGKWKTHPLRHKCDNFYPSRAADPQNTAPRLIPLTRGKFAIVDAEDYEELSKYKWCATDGGGTWYAVRAVGKERIKMHRWILNAPPDLLVDHIDRNGLHNRRSNIRLATYGENCQNQKRTANNTSEYKGVHWHKWQKKWAAAIRADNKRHHLGYFRDEIEAAKAYDRAARKYHGQFAHLNFPETQEQEPVRRSSREGGMRRQRGYTANSHR